MTEMYVPHYMYLFLKYSFSTENSIYQWVKNYIFFRNGEFPTHDIPHYEISCTVHW